MVEFLYTVFFIEFILINQIFHSHSTATLMMLAKPGISNEFELSKNSNQLIKSGIVIDWICEETTLMGNCSTTPKLTDWLEILSDKIFTDEYTDFNYCPLVYYIIVKVSKDEYCS